MKGEQKRKKKKKVANEIVRRLDIFFTDVLQFSSVQISLIILILFTLPERNPSTLFFYPDEVS